MESEVAGTAIQVSELNGVLEAATSPPRLYYRLGMELREGQLLIGDVAMGIESDRARSASIGYGVHHDWWGRGYATEAASLIVRFWFRDARASSQLEARYERSFTRSILAYKCEGGAAGTIVWGAKGQAQAAVR